MYTQTFEAQFGSGEKRSRWTIEVFVDPIGTSSFSLTDSK